MHKLNIEKLVQIIESFYQRKNFNLKTQNYRIYYAKYEDLSVPLTHLL